MDCTFFFLYQNNYSLSCHLIKCIHRPVLLYKRAITQFLHISNLFQPSESLFKFFYLFHSNIFYLLPSKYTCTLGTSLTRKFSTKFEKRISSSINLKNVSSSTIFRRSWWGEEKNLVTTPITCIVIGIRRLTINLVFASVVDSMHIAWGSIFHHFSSLPSFSFPFLLFVTVFHTRTIYTYI